MRDAPQQIEVQLRLLPFQCDRLIGVTVFDPLVEISAGERDGETPAVDQHAAQGGSDVEALEFQTGG